MGYAHEEAEDEVQRLFEGLISRESLRSVVPGETRFRSFMTVCLKNSMASEHRRKMRQKRGEGMIPESLENEASWLDTAHEQPEMALDRAWAREVFERAFLLLEADSLKRGRSEVFVLLKPVLRGESPEGGYAGLGVRLATTEGAARKAVFDLRARLGAFIRSEVAATVADPAQVEDEVRYLVSLI